LRIIDLGSPKLLPVILSTKHLVDSVVLRHPEDYFSDVRYFESNFLDLEIEKNCYDVFISPVTFNLLGLGRYGDKIDFNALPKSVDTIYNCLKPGGFCLLALTIGEDFLAFNNGIYPSHRSTMELFSSFKLVDIVPLSSTKGINFSYNTVFYQFEKP
jgi:hypothetical protein